MAKINLVAILVVGLASFSTGQNPLEKSEYAIVQITGRGKINGWVNIRQESAQSVVTFEGQVYNLPVGVYDLNVHENRDASQNCANVGGHFNPTNQRHGDLNDPERHAGDLGTIRSTDGIVRNTAEFRKATPSVTLYGTASRRNIIGLPLVISRRTDPNSVETEVPVACGIIVSERDPNFEDTMESMHSTMTGEGMHLDMDSGRVDLATKIKDRVHGIRNKIRRILVPSLRRHQPAAYHEYPAVNVDSIGLNPNPSPSDYLRRPGELAEIARSILRDFKKPFTVCYEPYGCITTNETWFDIKHRIANLRPQDPSVIKTEFLLRTRETCFREEILNPLDPQLVQSSSFRADRPTKLIVHGFTNSGHDPWVRRMTDALLIAGDFNVIAVDWKFGALPIYAQATANTRVVGLQIAYLVNTLVRISGLRPEDVHIIGHSLGAQIAGYAGQNITNLGRITGLDPAGPYFINMPPYVQLDRSDALYVEALHTNAAYLKKLGYGTTERVGNVDFYPNGGNYQPGCELLSLKLIPFVKQYWNSGDIFACNHNRAVDLYIDAISNPITAFSCDDYERFLRADCRSCQASPDATCAAVFGLEPGVDVQRLSVGKNVSMYFKTSSFPPYNLIHYRVTVKTDASGRPDVTGRLNVTLVGSANEIINRPLHRDVEAHLQHGATLSFLLTSSIELGDISEVHLHWEPVECATRLQRGCGHSLHVNQATVGRMTLEDPMALQATTFHPCGEMITPTAAGGRHGDVIPVQFGNYQKISAGKKAVLLSTPCP